MDILDVCKFFNATGNPKWFDGSDIGKGVIDQGVIYKEIERRAIDASPGAESVAKAFSRFIAEDEAGKQLYKAMRNAPAARQAPQDLIDVKPTEPKAEDLEAEAQELARGGMSITQARVRVQSAMLRRARAKADAAVADQRKPVADAERASENWQLGASRGSRRL
jgi:hypothetical protein